MHFIRQTVYGLPIQETWRGFSFRHSSYSSFSIKEITPQNSSSNDNFRQLVHQQITLRSWPSFKFAPSMNAINGVKGFFESDGSLSPIRLKVVEAVCVEKESGHRCNRMTIMSSGFVKKARTAIPRSVRCNPAARLTPALNANTQAVSRMLSAIPKCTRRP